MENNEIKEMLLDLKKGQEERDKILLDLKRGQEELFRGQEELFKGQEERDKILLDLKKGQKELFKGQKQLFEGQAKLINRVDKIEERQQNMDNKIDKISQSVAVIENDHGEKLQILLDVVTGHIKKFDSENKRIEKCEERLDDHDNKIYALNSAVQAY